MVIGENAPHFPALSRSCDSQGVVGLVYCPDVSCGNQAGLE